MVGYRIDMNICLTFSICAYHRFEITNVLRFARQHVYQPQAIMDLPLYGSAEAIKILFVKIMVQLCLNNMLIGIGCVSF